MQRGRNSRVPFGDLRNMSQSRIRSASESQDLKQENGLVGVVRKVLSSLRLVDSTKLDSSSSSILRNSAISSPDLSTSVMDVDVVVPTKPVVMFEYLAQFPQALVHPDFDNDIVNYELSNQSVVTAQMLSPWSSLGGESALSRTMLYIFELFELQPLPFEVLHRAVYYVHCAVATGHMLKSYLEPLCIAALRLACKIEVQIFRLRFLSGSMTAVNAMEKSILLALNYRLTTSEMTSFMRYFIPSSCVRNWQWPMAKALSALSTSNSYLTRQPRALVAAAIMHLVNSMRGTKAEPWSAEIYQLAQYDEEALQMPQAMLCRLLLVAKRKGYKPLFNTAYQLDQIVNHYHYILEERALDAAHLPLAE